MTLYQQIKAEIASRGEKPTHFTKRFFDDFCQAVKQFKRNYERGIDNSYYVDGVRLTHEYDAVYSSKFYIKNSCAYCLFLEIAYQHNLL